MVHSYIIMDTETFWKESILFLSDFCEIYNSFVTDRRMAYIAFIFCWWDIAFEVCEFVL